MFFQTLNSVGQNYFDLSKATITKTKTKKFKLKPITVASSVSYTIAEYNFIFDKSEITTFINSLRYFAKFSVFNFDSLKTVTLITKNDTTEFNNFASAFDKQIVLRFIDNLIMQKKTVILVKNKPITPIIKRLIVSQDLGGCIADGYMTYIDEKYFFDEVTAQGRKL